MKIGIMQLWTIYTAKKAVLAVQEAISEEVTRTTGSPYSSGQIWAPYVPVHVTKPVHIVGTGYITYAGTTTSSLSGGTIKVVGTSTTFPGLKASISVSEDLMKDMGVGAEEMLANEMSKEMSREMDRKLAQTLAQIVANRKKI